MLVQADLLERVFKWCFAATFGSNCLQQLVNPPSPLDFDGGMNQMWVRIKGKLGQQVGEADTEIATLKAQNGKNG